MRMRSSTDCIIGTIVKTACGEPTRIGRIKHAPGYGVTCDMMTTNGDARFVARMAADRAGIVARHVDQGIAYELDVLINGESIADIGFDEAMARINAVTGSDSYHDRNYDMLVNR